MEPRLSLRLTQRLILTPTLQQAIRLLQYSRQELVQYIRQELLENPALEELRAEPLVPAAAGEPPAPVPEREPSPDDGGEDAWSAYLDDYGRPEEPGEGGEAPSYEQTLSAPEQLSDHLLRQLNVAVGSEEERRIGFEVVGNIDDDGYLRADTGELAAALGAAPDEVERLVRLVQGFDPPGVGARDLAECLVLQLAQRGLAGGLEERIAATHLHDLEARRLKRIADAEGVSVEQVQRAARLIAGLEPRPGRPFSRGNAPTVLPDVLIEKVGGEYQVRLLEDGLPRLRLSGFYQRLARRGSLGADDREFIEKRVNGARWLIKSILQRQETILKVSRSIVKFQRDFLDRGIEHLHPLVLREVADDIGMHESTVSRVTSNKYAQTPQGLYELKYFFNSGIGRTGGEAVASVSVQDQIQRIVREEDPARPLSDLEIAERLRADAGLHIARRTVAKYRTILNILPASRRRQAF